MKINRLETIVWPQRARNMAGDVLSWLHMTSRTEQAMLALHDLASEQQEEIADLIINAAQPTIEWDAPTVDGV